DEVYVLGFAKHTLDEVKAKAADYCEIGFGQLNKGLKFFKRNDVEDIIFLGWMEPRLAISNIKMDFRMLALAARTKDRRADSVIRALIAEAEKDGLKIVNTTDFLPHLLVGEGVLTKRKPSGRQLEDIAFGREIALVSGGLDIGQTVVVRKHAVVAVEAMEGTDNCLTRAGEFAKHCVAVKMAKPEQDLRFDVPCFGPRTIERAVAAKIAVLAVEAGKTYILEREKTIALANASKFVVIGIGNSGVAGAGA
ncbi:MAG: LpxI family protein, partial [Kiritimatiellaeota bacterium]|nr:LpxI family protein [Kiritimatiellota bacterium]